METVRCEELQLELSAALKSKSGKSAATTTATSTVTWAPTPVQNQTQQQHLQHQQQQQQQQHQQHQQKLQQNAAAKSAQQQSGTEIDRIMAKIEQARLSIANVCDQIYSNTKIYIYISNSHQLNSIFNSPINY